jgi:excisionase family DNA binding protein
MEKKYYTINDLTRLFGVTRTTIYDWMTTGKLPYVIIGARRRVTAEALAEFIKAGGNKEETEEKRRKPLETALQLV